MHVDLLSHGFEFQLLPGVQVLERKEVLIMLKHGVFIGGVQGFREEELKLRVGLGEI